MQSIIPIDQAKLDEYIARATNNHGDVEAYYWWGYSELANGGIGRFEAKRIWSQAMENLRNSTNDDNVDDENDNIKDNTGKIRFQLGRWNSFYSSGEDVAGYFIQAKPRLEWEAAQGDLESLYLLGMCFTSDLNLLGDLEVDDAQAAVLFQRAAEQGHVEAQIKLAKCYKYKLGVEYDMVQAIEWLNRASAATGYTFRALRQGFLEDLDVKEQERVLGCVQYNQGMKSILQSLAVAPPPLGVWAPALKTIQSSEYKWVGLSLTYVCLTKTTHRLCELKKNHKDNNKRRRTGE